MHPKVLKPKKLFGVVYFSLEEQWCMVGHEGRKVMKVAGWEENFPLGCVEDSINTCHGWVDLPVDLGETSVVQSYLF